MTLADFQENLLRATEPKALTDLCRRSILHGTPFIFDGREDDYYRFRTRIADEYEVRFFQIYIVGSAKLGFSPHKGSPFDLDSDIDVAVVSGDLYDRILDEILRFQIELNSSRASVTEKELLRYHQFLEYTALGWIRPDKLPVSFRFYEMKNRWFEFFRSISNGGSEVGNYLVSAGVFKSYFHLERYHVSSLYNIRRDLTARSSQ
jgi:predicted nucleotidyltransferase